MPTPSVEPTRARLPSPGSRNSPLKPPRRRAGRDASSPTSRRDSAGRRRFRPRCRRRRARRRRSSSRARAEGARKREQIVYHGRSTASVPPEELHARPRLERRGRVGRDRRARRPGLRRQRRSTASPPRSIAPSAARSPTFSPRARSAASRTRRRSSTRRTCRSSAFSSSAWASARSSPPRALAKYAGTAVRHLGKRGVEQIAIALPDGRRRGAGGVVRRRGRAGRDDRHDDSIAAKPDRPVATDRRHDPGRRLRRAAAVEARRAARHASIGEAVNAARLMALTPANDMTPTHLAEPREGARRRRRASSSTSSTKRACRPRAWARCWASRAAPTSRRRSA